MFQLAALDRVRTGFMAPTILATRRAGVAPADIRTASWWIVSDDNNRAYHSLAFMAAGLQNCRP